MLTHGQKIGYGMARFGPSIMLDILGLATVLFYWGFDLLPGIYAGVSIGISYLVIALSQFGFGYLSDRTATRWGRRKPYIGIGAPFMALSFAMIFLPTVFVSASDTIGLFIWATFWISLFKMFYGMITTPLQSWMPEISEPEERPSVSGWQNTANFVAFAVATFGTVLLQMVLPLGLVSTTLIILLLVIIAIELIGFIPPLKMISKEGKPIEEPAVKKDVGYALKNRNYDVWLIVQGIISVSFAMITQVAFIYVAGPKSVLQFGTLQLIVFGVELLVVFLVFLVIWQKLIKRRGKRSTLAMSLIPAIVALPLTLVVGQVPGLPISAAIQGYIVIGVVVASLAGYYLLPYIIYADFAQVDELQTGEGRAGVYTGFSSIPLNIFQFASTVLLGFLLDLPNVTGQTYTYGLLLWGPISSLFLLLGIFVLRKTNIDPDFDALEKQYGRKRKK